MREEELPLDDLKGLAEDAMADKREEVGSEAQTRELWDVPTEDPVTLAEQQNAETHE